jgi:hypothetical protein
MVFDGKIVVSIAFVASCYRCCARVTFIVCFLVVVVGHSMMMLGLFLHFYLLCMMGCVEKLVGGRGGPLSCKSVGRVGNENCGRLLALDQPICSISVVSCPSSRLERPTFGACASKLGRTPPLLVRSRVASRTPASPRARGSWST